MRLSTPSFFLLRSTESVSQVTKRRSLVAAIALAVLLGAPAAQAEPDDLANDISNHIMSPFCDGVTLHDCPSDAAVDLRDRIESWARAGWSRDRIMAKLISEYGPAIRSTPPSQGAGLVAWLLPALALAAGAGVAWMLLRRWTARPATGADGGAPRPSLEDRRRIEAELDALRNES
jgi:cytochrome c-type biogenesis protein CcmH